MDTSIVSQVVASDDEFLLLPAAQRDRVWKWGYALAEYYRADGVKKTGPGGKYDRLAVAMGYKGTSNVMRVVKEWEDTRDWRVLLDGRVRNNKDYASKGPRSARFVAWVVNMAEHECRTDKAALDKIHMIFGYGGMVIPGFEGHVPGSIPRGCSKRHLQRIIADHRKEVTRARFGVSAVSSLPVLKTRIGIEPGMIYEFDDVLHDHEVIWNTQSVRVMELGLLDYASGCRVHYGHIPRERREDDGKRQAIDRKMARMFLAYVLRYIGVHPDKCVIMMEHGTATLSQDKIALLQSWGDGRIEIRKGGIEGKKQRYLGGRVARGKGNPQAKGRIEGSHSLIHNDMGHLPAQVGWTGRNEPALTWGMRKEAEQVALWQGLLEERGRADLAAMLDQPVMRYMEFAEYLTIKYSLINGRTDHDLEGWERNTTLEYNISGDLWIDGHDLDQDPAQREMLKMLVAHRPGLVRERRLSPAEVWEAGRARLVRIPLALYVQLIGDDADFGRTIKVNDGMIKVQDKLVNSGTPMHYLAETHVDGQPPRPLRDGEAYRVVINPYASEELIVLDHAGRVLGMAPLYVRVNPLTEDLYKTIGKVEARKSQDMARQKSRWVATNEHVQSRADANRAVAEEGGVATPSRKSSRLPRPSRKIVELEDADCQLPVLPRPRAIDELDDADTGADLGHY